MLKVIGYVALALFIIPPYALAPIFFLGCVFVAASLLFPDG